MPHRFQIRKNRNTKHAQIILYHKHRNGALLRDHHRPRKAVLYPNAVIPFFAHQNTAKGTQESFEFLPMDRDNARHGALCRNGNIYRAGALRDDGRRHPSILAFFPAKFYENLT